MHARADAARRLGLHAARCPAGAERRSGGGESPGHGLAAHGGGVQRSQQGTDRLHVRTGPGRAYGAWLHVRRGLNQDQFASGAR